MATAETVFYGIWAWRKWHAWRSGGVDGEGREIEVRIGR
jgi:hypothetical protein